MSDSKVFPDYERDCFSNLANLAKVFFGAEEKENLLLSFERKDFLEKRDLIFLFIDNFGWRFLQKYQDHPFLKRFFEQGEVVKATSQFPSTTAAHVTTLNTGLPVGEHGVYEWFFYEPKVDKIIAPLLFSLAGPKDGRGGLQEMGFSPEEIFPFQRNLYTDLSEVGVKSYVFGSKEYTPSPYSNIMFQGAEKILPYSSLAEAVVNLFEIREADDKRKFFYLYFDKIDSINHLYGPSSAQSEAESLAFLDLMERVFWQRFAKVSEEVAVVIFADHGQIETNPRETFYINKEIPEIKRFLKENKNGEILAPAGSARDMFLHIKEGMLDEAEDLLKKRLSGVAEVVRVDDFVKKGYFGKKVSQRFLERVGDLILLPYARGSVWWYEKGKFEMRYFGYHGGLTPEEMEIGICVI